MGFGKKRSKDELIQVARRRGTIFYSDLAAKIRSIAFNHNDRAFHELLGEISEDEDRRRRGMLSALVIGREDREPGLGFFVLAQKLGRDTKNKLRLWSEEVNRVHAAWAEIQPAAHSDVDLTMNFIASEINRRAGTHAIGELQNVRAKLRGLERRPGKSIFAAQTIQEDWAFHNGGRSELQFNIGFEQPFGLQLLRYGVAFSFQLSQTLPSIEVLIPQVQHFNDYLRSRPEDFADMRMWHYSGHEGPSATYSPGPITPELVTPPTFVFLGKRQPTIDIHYEAILDLFDRLLPLFEYVVSGGRHISILEQERGGFHFRPGPSNRQSATSATLAERELDINLRHNVLQSVLYRRLAAKYGPELVGTEQLTAFGTKIDVVVRHSATEFSYYEIKTALSPRACLREAFGQLLEYAYWPGAQEAKYLIVCGEKPLDRDGNAYLRDLNKRFGLPVRYEQIVI